MAWEFMNWVLTTKMPMAAPDPSATKYCIHCAHHFETSDGAAYCAHRGIFVVCPVSGRQRLLGDVPGCHLERSVQGHCGPAGRDWMLAT